MRFRIEVVSFKPSSSKSRNGRLQEQVREVIKMRPKPSDLFFVGLTLAGLLPILSIQAQTKPERSPDRDEINRRFTLPAKAHVEVVAINGSVDIKAIDGDTASVEIERTARSRAELDCNKVVLRQVLGKLLIKSEMGCENIVLQVKHRVLLSLPRYVDLSVNGVSGPVNIGEIDGALRISGNSGQINLAQAGRGSRITGNSGTTTIKLRQLNPGGLELSGNHGPINLYVADELNVVVKVSGHSGTVSSDLPNVKFHKTGAADYRAGIGFGGPTIYVERNSGNLSLHPYQN